MSNTLFCSYLRVSTTKQGVDGFGIDAQRKAVSDFIRGQNGELIEEFVEAESGANDDRRQLSEALALCRARKATLLVAKLDRLARSVSFVSRVMDSDVTLVAADNPHASRLVLHMLAAVAEFEREQISHRTRVAMAAAKARGVRFGTHGAKLAIARKAEATDFARSICNHLHAAKAAGHFTCEDTARYLNSVGSQTRLGQRWSASSVWKVQKRLSALPPPKDFGGDPLEPPEVLGTQAC